MGDLMHRYCFLAIFFLGLNCLFSWLEIPKNNATTDDHVMKILFIGSFGHGLSPSCYSKLLKKSGMKILITIALSCNL
jgi:hypothetical protein